MNKRQKKKQLKRAIKNFVNFEDSKQDKVIMNTIGTNVKLRNELLHSYFLYRYAKEYIEKFMQVAGILFDSVKSAITSIAKDLEMEPEELLKAANSLKKAYGISGSQAIDLIVKNHHNRINTQNESVEEGKEIVAIAEPEIVEIQELKNNEHTNHTEASESHKQTNMWNRIKEKAKRWMK